MIELARQELHASLLGFCLESLLIDNVMLGAINRNVRGIEVNDKTLSLDVIANVCPRSAESSLPEDYLSGAAAGSTLASRPSRLSQP